MHSHGHLSDYAHDLAKMAKVSGAHVAIVTDYDIPGILIASALQGVVWLGVNEEMLKHFGLFKENKQRVVPYNPKKDRIKPETFKKMVESDNRFYGTVDIDFLQENKVELDTILSHVGSERLWNYLMNKLKATLPDFNGLTRMSFKACRFFTSLNSAFPPPKIMGLTIRRTSSIKPRFNRLDTRVAPPKVSMSLCKNAELQTKCNMPGLPVSSFS